MRTPFYNIDDPGFGLNECADKLLAERRERYLRELDRLLGRCEWQGDTQRARQVRAEMRRLQSSGEASQQAESHPCYKLRRIRHRYEWDVRSILAHLPPSSRATARIFHGPIEIPAAIRGVESMKHSAHHTICRSTAAIVIAIASTLMALGSRSAKVVPQPQMARESALKDSGVALPPDTNPVQPEMRFSHYC